MGEQADLIVDAMIDDPGFRMRPESRAMKKGPKCPTCGNQPKLTNTTFGWRRDCCGLHAWGRNAPLVDKATHAARSYAHKVFDSLWQSGLVGRSEAYALLAQELGIRPEDCHMKLMDRATADRVPDAVYNISRQLRGLTT